MLTIDKKTKMKCKEFEIFENSFMIPKQRRLTYLTKFQFFLDFYFGKFFRFPFVDRIGKQLKIPDY
jgi:hypothetical protein